MSSQDQGCGCLAIIGVCVVIGLISKCNDKHSSAPKVSQPSTGYVSPARSYDAPSSPSAPTISEPFGQLQSGGFADADAALKMINSLRDPAYVKVVDSSGRTRATIYLRAGESYALSVDPGSYTLKYVSGPSNEWRGTAHYFGSRSSFRSGRTSYIGTNQQLTVTFYQTVSRYGSGGKGLQKIGEDEF
jgi:hypothetical protein